ncbi:sigma-70 family RNA polymerase sigma factor [Ktedonosporobacter rubrisoli]|uniref:RNA polymerase sigma factor n=1 Tax=Ktedonosporobacter rubrisoli TaxID=2509675 RepID=A0A4P6K352_KTERU|nr:sigma-70 family RNA polymerase sigma factor [Ktedonosporobacter rubrisoli]QBD82170.1 sigma-70 family RNA polymerase sigma factor [Ktedonosporobacter rubrisoli]
MQTLLTDEELTLQCKKELPYITRSYEILVQRHMNHVYRIVYSIVGNKEEAEDITQEVFVKVFNNLKNFEQRAAFSSWLYRIATNSALDALDKIKHRPAIIISMRTKPRENKQEENDPLNLHASAEASPEEQAMRTELRECINRVLKKLDHEHASLLVMRDFNDLSYAEIAQALNKGLSAVKMGIHRARQAFKEAFGQFCGKIDVILSTYASKGNTKKG